MEKILEIIRKYEKTKEEYKNVSKELTDSLLQMPLNHVFQDPTTNLVYKVVEPTGSYIEYKKISYVRTKKKDEKRGSLSKKEAESYGFVIS